MRRRWSGGEEQVGVAHDRHGHYQDCHGGQARPETGLAQGDVCFVRGIKRRSGETVRPCRVSESHVLPRQSAGARALHLPLPLPLLARHALDRDTKRWTRALLMFASAAPKGRGGSVPIIGHGSLARWLGWVCYNWHGPGTVAAYRVFGREATRGASSLEQQAWAPPALVEAPFSYTVCPTPAISVSSSSIGKIPSAIVISPRRSLR
jgi:hypothetical protein